jgi:hypothetical protein
MSDIDQRLSSMEEKITKVAETLEIIEGREERRGRILDRLVDDELERDEMYKFVRKHVIGTGTVAAISTVFLILWYAANQWFKT